MHPAAEPSTLLTLRLQHTHQQHFESLRRLHFPPALNRVPAHLTLFHRLPADDATRTTLQTLAQRTTTFAMRVTGLRSLGRGVAFTLRSPAAQHLHATLRTQFQPSLSPQDLQPFHPHIVVQNKVAPTEAKPLLEVLQSTFEPFDVTAIGLDWWDYLHGPWRLREAFDLSPELA